jgi:nitrogen regulatory protein P-II 1
MKLITAIIKPEKLDSVREALYEAEIKRITIDSVTGHGQQEPDEDVYRGVRVVPDLIPKVRLDIACNDEFVKITCDAIIKGARTGEGELGDGKIFIRPLEDCIRIRTGERGNDAI